MSKNNLVPTLRICPGTPGVSTLVYLTDPISHTLWHRAISNNSYNCNGQAEKLIQEIARLRAINFETSPDAEQALYLAIGLSYEDLSKTYNLNDYIRYINRCHKLAADTGMLAVMVKTGSRLLPDTFVVNTKTGDYWSGNLITTALKELNMTLTGAKRSRRFQSYLENYPTLLKGRFGERHVTVLKDEVGTLTRFYAETDRFTRELKLKEIDNKAEKMTLAEFLEQYCNKEDEK